MEAIEGKLVNDMSIMEATTIERQDHSGRIKFRTTLPDGSPLESEWVQESDKAKAGILWAEAVRGAIVQNSQEAATRARRALQEARAVQSARPQLLAPDGRPLQSGELSTPAVAPSPIQTAAAQALDPSAYVRVQFEAAKARRDELVKQQIAIEKELATVTQQKLQWQGILQAMGVSINEHSDQRQVDGKRDAGSSIRIDLRTVHPSASELTDDAEFDSDTGIFTGHSS